MRCATISPRMSSRLWCRATCALPKHRAMAVLRCFTIRRAPVPRLILNWQRSCSLDRGRRGMERRRTLGQGLAALLPGIAAPQPNERVHEIPLDAISPNPYQPRREFAADELSDLAASIKAQGLLQPIVV